MTAKIKELNGFRYTTSIKKLRNLKKRTRIIPGGTSAGKTYGILPLLIDLATKTPMLEISVVSESVPHLRKGALKDFLKIMKATGRFISDNYHQTHLTYTFSNGAYIEFFSADQEDKVRGPRRNVLYINECNNINFETYHQLAIRTSKYIFLDFNPSNDFWVYQELKDDEDVEWLTLTYKDNEALSESIVKEIEKAKFKAYVNPYLTVGLDNEENIKSKYWHNWWRVYGLGLLGSLEGVIFDWDIKELPKEARLLGFGQDFGFTNDPTTLTAIYESSGELYFDEWIYQTGLTNNDISDLFKKLGVNQEDTIVADSAEPKSIEELYRLKWNIEGAEKGADSIKNGIDILKRYTCYLTPRSTNLIKERRNYCWDTDKAGNKLNKPIDDFNHGMDGIRYFALNKLGHGFHFEFSIR